MSTNPLKIMMNNLQTLLLLSAAVAAPTTALSTVITQQKTPTSRPLLRQFGLGISERVINSKQGYNRFGLEDHYTSAETIPCLDMQTTSSSKYASNGATRDDIREAYTANNDNIQQHGDTTRAATQGEGGRHGRSSGSGCCIIRLQGKDAASVRGLVDFADDFFNGVDSDDGTNTQSGYAARRLKDLGVFRIENNVHAGFDHDVNDEGKVRSHS